MSDKDSDKRHTEVANLMPASWDRHSFGLAGEIRAFLTTINDEGTGIDTGGGDGTGDLWAKIGGIEYFISIRKSNNQLAKEGKPLPPMAE